jgi:hypothetical protein
MREKVNVAVFMSGINYLDATDLLQARNFLMENSIYWLSEEKFQLNMVVE